MRDARDARTELDAPVQSWEAAPPRQETGPPAGGKAPTKLTFGGEKLRQGSLITAEGRPEVGGSRGEEPAGTAGRGPGVARRKRRAPTQLSAKKASFTGVSATIPTPL